MTSRRHRVSSSFVENLPVWLAVVWSFALLFHAHRTFLSPPTLLHPLDEGYVNAFAWRMTLGRWLPYVDGVSHRGPLMYWAAAIFVKLFGPTSWLGLRVLSMLVGLSTLVLTFFAGARAGRPFAGAIASVFVAAGYLIGLWPIDGLAYSGEHLLDVFAMAALLSLVLALDEPKPSVRLVALSGAFAALGALSKQVGAVTLVPLFLWLVAAAFSRPEIDRAARRSLLLAFVGGAALPVAITVARYASEGELSTLYYYTVTYNTDVYLAPFDPALRTKALGDWFANHTVLLAIAFVVSAACVARPLLATKRLGDVFRAYDAHGFTATVGLGALATIFASNAALRDFAHYYVQLVPWCGLAFGALLDQAIESPRIGFGFRTAFARALILAPALVLVSAVTSHRFEQYSRDRRAKRGFVDVTHSPTCAFVRENSDAGDALFVWGFQPEFYTACGRRPASRYVFTTFVAGFVPWFEHATAAQDEARTVPGSRKLLIDDLEASEPPVLLDVPRSMGKRSIRRYRELRRYLDAHYCTAKQLPGGIEAFLRKPVGEACPH